MIVEIVRRKHTFLISNHLQETIITPRIALAVFATEAGISEAIEHRELKDLASKVFPQLTQILNDFPPDLAVGVINDVLDGVWRFKGTPEILPSNIIFD